MDIRAIVLRGKLEAEESAGKGKRPGDGVRRVARQSRVGDPPEHPIAFGDDLQVVREEPGVAFQAT